MNYSYTTQLPNEIVDQYLRHLNQSEIKILLIVLRQTLGWIDPKTKKRKRKDWITISFFSRRTGLTHKSISFAIQSLIEKELIVALDYHEQELQLPKDRRGKRKIYYAYAPYFRALKANRCREKLSNLFTYRHNTKPTPIKPITKEPKTSSEKQSDYNRYMQLIRNKRNPPNT